MGECTTYGQCVLCCHKKRNRDTCWYSSTTILLWWANPKVGKSQTFLHSWHFIGWFFYIELSFLYRSISYGAIGHVLGHELTHGFDTLGKFHSYMSHHLLILLKVTFLNSTLIQTKFDNVGVFYGVFSSV